MNKVENPKYPTSEERFWRNVRKGRGDECWRWTASKSCTGYGSMMYKGKTMSAHRASWIIHNGPIPKGKGYHGTCVLHRCDNPECTNPDHLFLGSHADNMDDKAAKGRCATVFTAKQVKRIRALGERMRQSEVAKLFNTTRQNIFWILNRKTHKKRH